MIMIFGGSNAPSGWLFCHGQSLLRTEYPKLFACIGIAYGIGDDTEGGTTFNVPDLRDRFPQGASDTNTLGSSIEAGLPNITGSTTSADRCMDDLSCTGALLSLHISSYSAGPNGNYSRYAYGFDASKGETKLDGTFQNDVYGKSDTVQPPSICVNYIIKY